MLEGVLFYQFYLLYQYNSSRLECYLLSKRNRMFNYTHNSSTTSLQSLLQLYQTNSKICSQYIRMASERLYLDEAKRINEANELLEKLSTREKVKDLSEWDVFTTRDSVMLEDLTISNLSHNLSINLSNITHEAKGRLITRRNALGSRTSRDFDGNISDAIVEIEATCSPKSATLIKRLLEDYKKLKAKAMEADKKEKAAKLREKVIEELQQKNIMLNQKLDELQFEIGKLENENAHIKSENRELNEVLYKMNTELNSEKKIKLYGEIASTRSCPSQLPNAAIHILSKVVEERESLILLRHESVIQIEANIERLLFQEDNSCYNCCSMLRKLKNSILAYKYYLQKEGEQFQIMYDTFKLRIEAQENNQS